MPPAKKARMKMTDDHKTALAAGRREGAVAKAYLSALAASKPKRGRKRSQKSIDDRLAKIEQELKTADPLRIVQLVQEQFDLRREKEAANTGADISKLEADFVKIAKSYSERKGLSYEAWKAGGVKPEVLRKAGIR